MIGLAPPGRIRPWRLAAACSALRAAFPGAKVHIHHYDFRAGFADFIVHEAMTITEVTTVREMLAWRPRRLRITAEILDACVNEEAITALIAGVVPTMQRGTVVTLGEIPEAEAKQHAEGRPIARPARKRSEHHDLAEPYPVPFGEWALPAAEASKAGAVVAEQVLVRRGPRLGRRVLAEELRPLLRGVVIR